MGPFFWWHCSCYVLPSTGQTAEESNKQGEPPPPHQPATHNATWTKGELWSVCTGMYPWLHSAALLKSPAIPKCLFVHGDSLSWERESKTVSVRRDEKKVNKNRVNNERGMHHRIRKQTLRAVKLVGDEQFWIVIREHQMSLLWLTEIWWNKR